MMALLVLLIRLDPSITEGRDSPGKNRANFFLGVHARIAIGEDAFPYRSKPQN